MKKVYVDTFYATVYEDFKQKDGDDSLYSNLMFNPTTMDLMEGYRSTTKSELKEVLDKRMSNFINLSEFTVKETNHGWIYERYIKWLDEDGNDYEIVKEGEHTDHEMFTVDISFYEDVYGIFAKLKD